MTTSFFHGVPSPQLLTADALLPMTSSSEFFAERAGVVIDGGLVLAFGPLSHLRTQFGDLEEHYTPGIMLPGLVNAHTHLELGYERNRIPPPQHFTHWVSALMKNYPAPEHLRAAVTRAVQEGVRESLQGGVTSIGDISRHCDLTRSLLTDAPVRTTSYGEIIGLGKMRDRQHAYLAAAANRAFASAHLTIGLSPHAPYTVEGPTLRAAVERAIADHLPLTMHLGELSEERAFLSNASGELADWPVMRNVLDADVPHHAHGPIFWAAHYGLLGPEGAATKIPTILAHVNYCSGSEMELLQRSQASIAYCPRTHAYFGHDKIQPHLYREFLDAKLNVGLGTDSLASNPSLSILAEAAFLWDRDRYNPFALMEMATMRGARALGLNAGTLAPGRLADVIVLAGEVKPRIDALITSLFQSNAHSEVARAVWVGGVKVV